MWLYWISPLQYAQRALMVRPGAAQSCCYPTHCLKAPSVLQINEFTATRWQHQPYSTSPLSPYVGQNLGTGVLSQYGFPHHYKCALQRR